MTTRSIKEPFDFLPVRKSSLWKSYKWVFENHRDILIGNLNMICVSVVKHENFQFEFWNFEKMCHFWRVNLWRKPFYFCNQCRKGANPTKNDSQYEWRHLRSILSRSRNSSFILKVVLCRIRLCPTLNS